MNSEVLPALQIGLSLSWGVWLSFTYS